MFHISQLTSSLCVIIIGLPQAFILTIAMLRFSGMAGPFCTLMYIDLSGLDEKDKRLLEIIVN